MRKPAFLLKSSPPSRGVFPQTKRASRRVPCILAATSVVMLAGCATSGSGDTGVSLGGGGGGSQSTSSLAASSSPTWSSDSGKSTSTGSDASGSTTPVATLTGPVEQVSTTVVTAIVPLTSALTSTTQTIGAATGLGTPVSGMLATLGSALGGGGSAKIGRAHV